MVLKYKITWNATQMGLTYRREGNEAGISVRPNYVDEAVAFIEEFFRVPYSDLGFSEFKSGGGHVKVYVRVREYGALHTALARARAAGVRVEKTRSLRGLVW